MSRAQIHRIQVPDELREVLLEFIINYLLEQPGDIINYAVEYFTQLRDRRTATYMKPAQSTHASEPESDTEGKDDQHPARPAPSGGRRISIFSEPINPEEPGEDQIPVHPKTDEQRRRLIEALQSTLIFRSQGHREMQQVIDAMFEKKVKAGEYIIKQGETGDYFYVIQEGVFEAYTKAEGEEPKKINTYNGAGSFGELALMYSQPRQATVQATTDGYLWGMDRKTFRRIMLTNSLKKLKVYEALINSVPMLKELETFERTNIADALTSKTYAPGETIISQGDVADGMYFIEEGRVTISVMDDSGKEVEINHLGKGSYFGELALVTHRPRAASAFAIDEVRVAFLDVQAFERLLGPCMQIMKRNINNYEDQMMSIFGSKANIADLRS